MLTIVIGLSDSSVSSVEAVSLNGINGRYVAIDISSQKFG